MTLNIFHKAEDTASFLQQLKSYLFSIPWLFIGCLIPLPTSLSSSSPSARSMWLSTMLYKWTPRANIPQTTAAQTPLQLWFCYLSQQGLSHHGTEVPLKTGVTVASVISHTRLEASVRDFPDAFVFCLGFLFVLQAANNNCKGWGKKQ